MSNKGLLTLVLGATALVGAGFVSSSSGAVAVRDTGVVPIDGGQITVTTVGTPVALPPQLPTRPPARSLYRPGSRNPPTVLE